MPDRPYLFYELTNSLCATCLTKVEAKVIIQDDNVYLDKRCPDHGFQRVLISTDVEYYKLSRQTLKPGQMPLKFNTPIKYGCPYDCGLCPDHEQHSCLTLLEITDQCNLTCPICYSESSPQRVGTHRTLVVVLKKGLNDNEIGDIIDFALEQKSVRGVTFQPIQSAGRLDHFDPATDRLTLAEIRQQILKQSPIFKPRDVIPVPCHPD